MQIVEGGIVGRDQAGPRAAFDAHVADRHAAFHREAADRLAGVLDDMARAAADADLGDQRQDDVLGRHAGSQPAIDAHLEGLRLRLEQALGRQHVLHLAGADAEGERAERAVRGGVAVAADDGHAGLRQPQLGADDVDDALPVAADAVERDAELARVGCPSARAAWPPAHRRSAASDRASGCCDPRWRPSCRAGARSRPRSRSPVNACGDVTSWTRCRSM